MPSHQDRVRKNYEEWPKKIDGVYYFPCERYSDHVYNHDNKCIFCNKTKLKIESQRS